MWIADDGEVAEVRPRGLRTIAGQLAAVHQAAQRMNQLDVDQVRGVQVPVAADPVHQRHVGLLGHE